MKFAYRIAIPSTVVSGPEQVRIEAFLHARLHHVTGHEAAEDIEDANEIDETNWLRLASYYGAEGVQPPPDRWIHVVYVHHAPGPGAAPSSHAQSAIVAIPEGYELYAFGSVGEIVGKGESSWTLSIERERYGSTGETDFVFWFGSPGNYHTIRNRSCPRRFSNRRCQVSSCRLQ